MSFVPKRSAAYGLWLAAWAGAVVPAGFAQEAAPQAASQPAATPQQELWESIVTLSRPTPTTLPYETWFNAAHRQRTALLSRIRLYLTLYPGGVHRDDAVRLELNTLFELGTIDAGGLETLCERVAEYLRQPPSQVILEEAAYWDIICQRQTEKPPDTQPTSATSPPTDVALLDAYRDYMARFPHSRYVPRMADLLFENATRRDDHAAMRRIVETLQRDFPDHAVSAAVAGVWRRVQAVGQQFSVQFQAVDGREVDTRHYVGSPVAIIVWAASDAASRRCVQSVERFRSTYPDLRTIGVSLDADAQRVSAAARELAVAWPQQYDGLGRGGEFVRRWGIRGAPCVLLIDRAGRLVGAAGESGWEALAHVALRRSAASDTQPASAPTPPAE